MLQFRNSFSATKNFTKLMAKWLRPASLARANQEIALLREEIRIKDAHILKMPLHQRLQ
jgi:hypothetical protein